jgi:NAD(P)-dependent dehydrogenase (short-subunit alcohol dehydrogenase family)
MPSKYINKLSGQNILILGGTSGIGFAVAEASIEHGANVFVSGSTPAKVSTTIERLRLAYPDVPADRIAGEACDLANREALESNLEKLLTAVTSDGSNKINHIVYTAGNALSPIPLAEFSVAAIESVGSVHYIAPLILAKFIPRFMHVSADSSFTITGGVNTQRPTGAGRTLYCAMGAALEGVTRGLALELKPLRVNMVVPGAVRTERWGPAASEELFDKFAEMTTVGRIGKPEDVAEAYIYLMKDGFATASFVETNGGRLLV